MNKVIATFIVSVAMSAAGSIATANTADYVNEDPELCTIYVDDGPDGTYLAAYASEGLEGEYVFSLRQAGWSGSSEITQSGEFEASYEGPTLLSEMMLSLDGDYEISLQTYSWDGEFMCRVII